MDSQDVYNQILDVPFSFRRTGYVYTALIASMTAAIARNTRAMDALGPYLPTDIQQQLNPPAAPPPLLSPSIYPLSTTLSTSKFGWLETIGKLFGIIRNQLEIDNNYRNRILATLSAPHGTPRAIESFILLSTGLTTTVTEDFTNPSYIINFETPVSDAQIEAVVVAINWVRPAGVPFSPAFQVSGGLYLNTLNYLGVKLVSGSYLTRPIISLTVSIGANTDNPTPLLPIVYLIDPFITASILPTI